MSDEFKPKLDEFTSKVVSDPAKPQETLLLLGFLGASSQPDHTRIYSDLTLESYVDVANADIIHVEPMPKNQSPMGGSYLWVKKDADVFPGSRTGELSAKAKFLEGPITSEAAATAGVAQPALPKTVPLVVCHPTIVVRTCPAPTQPGALEFGVAAAHAQPGPVPQLAPTVACAATAFCHPTLAASVCHICPTAPIICHASAAPVCHPTHAASVCFICPTTPAACHLTLTGPECVVHTPLCPQQVASLACGEQLPGAAQFAVAAPPVHAMPPATAELCVPPTPRHLCPTQFCPTPRHQCPTVNQFHCPSVAGFDCPSVNRFHCPSVAGFDCPSVNEFHCPSVNNFHCPPKTSHAADCPPTPQIQHCPTPNNICPFPTTNCPSVGEICQTSSPLFC